ncbi:hypothetical protein LWI29_005262 [Acer saccharum]|uniref:Uncharacterized protein n=1 Tax=Acer saccharum TaxID=4024 RepID=A0AA39RFU8_ACESA|nr:hypothetical protein LWI29_005262 [Acer saccharum]
MELLKLSKFKFQLQALINEARHLKVSYLQNDNALLENKQKELKETIHRLLQARENFINAYEESTCDMKRSIETRDRKLTVLSQKINSHLTLFDSIEKEAFSIKQVVDNVERIALHLEVGSLGIVLRRIQDAVASMNQQDKKAFHSALELKEEGDVNTTIENNRIEDMVQSGGESPTKASPLCQENKSVGSKLLDNDDFTSCVSEASGLSTNWSQI